MTVPSSVPDQEVPAAPLPVADRVGRRPAASPAAGWSRRSWTRLLRPPRPDPAGEPDPGLRGSGRRPLRPGAAQPAGRLELARDDVQRRRGGNGRLSDGRYSSLAPDLGLVLVKVGERRRASATTTSPRGIEWVWPTASGYGIRVLNISCGGDYEASYLTDRLSRVAEAAVRAGIVVVCAVGNQGERPGYVLPPASTPAVISVGGINDLGDPSLGRLLPYRSSYGPTVDGVQKPEIITLADFIAAPILPGDAHREARRSSCHARRRAADGELSAHHLREPRRVRPARRGSRVSSRTSCARSSRRASTTAGHRRALQAGGRHELRRANRDLRGRADAGGEPRSRPGRGEAHPDADRQADARASRSTARAGEWFAPRRQSRRRSRRAEPRSP